jgi:hypothetical protein
MPGSQSRTAAATASRSRLRVWLPDTATTLRLGPGGRHAEGVAVTLVE